MYSTFGEDAENMVWVLFYEFILEYQGCDFVRLPGLVRRFLIFRLMRLMQQQGMRWDTEEFLESETFCEEATECEALQKVINEIALNQEFVSLPTKEIQVLEEVYFKNNTYSESARNLNCTFRSIRYHRDSALERLKEKFKATA